MLHEENKNVFAERHRLITRRQEDGESLDDFAIDLQNIVEHCSVSVETEATLVQSVFVAGLRNDKTRESMLRDADEKLNLAQLLEKAKTIEIAALESRKMAKHDGNSLNYVGNSNWGYSRTVLKPGKMNEQVYGKQSNSDISTHRGSAKVSDDTVCYNCYRKGHLSYHCTLPKAKKPRQGVPFAKRNVSRKRAYEERINQLSAAMEDLKMSLEEDDEISDDETTVEQDTEEDASNWVNNIMLGKPTNNITPAFVELMVNNSKLLMECDTGACATICSLNTYNDCFSMCRILPDQRKFFVLSGESVGVLGKIKVKVRVSGELLNLWLLIVKSPKNFVPLLGRDWLNIIWPKWRNTFKLNSLKEALLTCVG